MKKQILSLLLLTSLSQAEDFYLGYDFLKVNYEDSGVNKEFDPTAVTWKAGVQINPLISEPVFMILHKDLVNTWEGK